MGRLLKFTLSLSLFILSSVAYNQCGPLATPYNQNNGQDGIMFDINCLTSVEITNFDINCGGTTHDFEIYAKMGTHVGSENTPGDWTLIATANNVNGPVNVATPIPTSFSWIGCAGDVLAFYVTSTGAGSIDYTNGAMVGGVIASDANIEILTGTGKDYPFNTSFTPRSPNITVYYNCLAMSCCALQSVTVNPSACDPFSGTYETTGQITFINPPAGGTLTVEDCNGNSQVFNPPFVSPLNYTITGQTPDGAGCDITATFSSDPTCTATEAYVAPAPCATCNIDNFTANIGFCDGVTDTYSINGDVDFSNAPGGGTLVIEVDNGTTVYDTIINNPFVSPQTWSISGIPADAAASTVTVYFSNDPACTSVININAPPSCACVADIGTFTTNITGGSTNNYVLCYGDQLDLSTNNDFTPPDEQFAPPGPAYDPGVSWLIYSCPPSVAVTPDPVLGITDDPCFLGVVSDLNFSDLNDMAWINAYPPGTFTDNTIYWVPITMYSMSGGTYSYVNTSIPCYEMGTPIAAQYLEEFTSNSVEDCQAGTVTTTVNGGLPAVDGSNFTASNLLPATASFANTTAADGGTIVITGLQNGDMYSFDVTDDNGCPYTISGGPFVGVEDPGYSYSQTTFCTNEPGVNATITGTGGGTFTAPAGLTINGVSGQVNPLTSTPGVYNVTYTTPDPVCFADSIIPVTVNPLPGVNAGLDQTICAGDIANLTYSGAASYNTDNGVGAGANPAVSPAVTTTYTVTGTDANGCVNTDQVDVIVNPLDDPSYSYNGGLTHCQTGPDPTANITGDPGGTFSYVATAGGPTLDINVATGDVTLASSDLGTYDITYTTTGLCPQSSTLQMVVTDAPIADFTLDVYCANAADPLPTYINGGGGGIFSAPAGLVINANTGQVDLDASTPGLYTVTNNIAASGGCSAASAQDDIEIFELPVATISGGTSICEGDPYPDLTIDFTAGATAWNLTYNMDGNPVNINSAANQYLITGASPGTYDLVTITDANGCTNAQNSQAIVIENPAPVMTAMSDEDVCEAGSLNPADFVSDIPGTTFGWTNLSGIDIGFGLNGMGNINPFTAMNTSGADEIATVEVTPVSPAGCVGTPIQFDIISHPLPNILFSGDPLMGCEPHMVTFSNMSTPGGQNCQWQFGDGSSATGCGTVTNTYNAGTYDVTLTVTTADGCSNSDTYANYVTVAALPVASFSWSPQTIDVQDTEVEFNNSSSGAEGYEWTFGDESPMSNVENPTHFFPNDEPGSYTVTLVAYSNNGACTDTAEAVITIDDVIIFYVPNTFTPDGDVYNETFSPVFTSGYDPYDFHLTIYNRWGEIVFESYDASKGWDGTYSDQGLVEDGVYIWQIEFKETMSDKRHTHRGHVTVLK